MKSSKGSKGKLMSIIGAFFLIIVLIMPVLIQGFHIHKRSDCCHLPHHNGINLPAHHHHSANNCPIYNFQYTLVLSPEGLRIPPPLITSFKEYLPGIQQKTGNEPSNASQRAPPFIAV